MAHEIPVIWNKQCYPTHAVEVYLDAKKHKCNCIHKKTKIKKLFIIVAYHSPPQLLSSTDLLSSQCQDQILIQQNYQEPLPQR